MFDNQIIISKNVLCVYVIYVYMFIDNKCLMNRAVENIGKMFTKNIFGLETIK